MPKNALIRKIVSEGEMRIEELRKKLNVGNSTVRDWVIDGRLRRSDNTLIRLEAFKGPDGGWRTSEGCYLRFLENLNAKPRVQ
jgi:transposase